MTTEALNKSDLIERIALKIHTWLSHWWKKRLKS